MIVLRVTLRSIYREQAIAYISTHAKELKKRTRKTSKTSKQLLHQKTITNSTKLSGFVLIRKFRSRASICKKKQLNRSYKTQVMNKRSLNSNLFEIKFYTFKNMLKLVIWIEEIITKKCALVSLDLDKQCKSCDHFKSRG